jgi:hypothetical protein
MSYEVANKRDTTLKKIQENTIQPWTKAVVYCGIYIYIYIHIYTYIYMKYIYIYIYIYIYEVPDDSRVQAENYRNDVTNT